MNIPDDHYRCAKCGPKHRMFFAPKELTKITAYCMSCLTERNRRRYPRTGTPNGLGWKSGECKNTNLFAKTGEPRIYK